MVPTAVDEDWHAICQTICKGVEGSEWEAMYYQYKDLHQAVESKKSGENKKAKVLWALKDAKDKGVDFRRRGQGRRHQDERKAGLLGNLKTPTAALAKALEGLEQGESVSVSEW